MFSFSNYLDEVFTKPSRYRKSVNKDNSGNVISYRYKAFVNGKELIVNMVKMNLKNEWELYFSVDGNTEITGEGDEISIFSTVLSTIQDFVNVQDPSVVEFSTDPGEETRDSLYNKMIKRFSSKIGYSAKTTTGMYQLTKK